ncbi:MAG: protein-S-isoprenylcysteine O-methyltransferase [Pseudomonadota bacterium]
MKKLGQAVLVVVFLGLMGLAMWRWPINGWGSMAWLASMFAINVIRAPFAKANKANVITEKAQARKEAILLGLVSLGGYVPLIHLATGWLAFANYTVPFWVPILGALSLIPTLYLFWRSHVDLGRNWSVTTEIREEHTLVTQGVYRRVRHPMYTAIWALFLVQPLLVHNWIAGFSASIAFGIMYVIRVPYEEAMMRKQFGQEYEDYCARSGRLMPKLG